MYDTIFGDDVATISGPNHGYPSESLASTIGADAHMGIQHDNCQMGATFEHILNVGPAFGVQDFDVQPNMPSSIEPQGIQVTNSILDNAATLTPPASPRVPCTVCGRTFGRSRDLRRHVIVKHNPNARAYACPELGCRYSNLRKDKLQLHRRTCHGRWLGLVNPTSDICYGIIDKWLFLCLSWCADGSVWFCFMRLVFPRPCPSHQ